jgi:Transposase Tn5 dimerisation domain
LNYQSVIREQGSLGAKPDPRRPIEEKESIRWRNGYEQASSLQQSIPQSRIVYVADREADFFELLAAAAGGVTNAAPKAGFVIRSQHDRALDSDKSLRATLARAPVLGEVSFDIPGKGTRKARTVTQQLRARRVRIKAPKHLKSETPVEVTAVYAVERNPPKGQNPVAWLLLTSEPVTTDQDAATIVRWYLCRWQIEIFFRVLKSGCKVEELQLQHAERIEIALAFYCIVAWRVLWLTMLGRSCPEIDCDAVFETEEWQAAYIIKNRQAPPDKPPDLATMISIIASFGGFLGRKGDGFPGPKSLWIGLQRVQDFAAGIAYQKAINDSS